MQSKEMLLSDFGKDKSEGPAERKGEPQDKAHVGGRSRETGPLLDWETAAL